MSEPLRDHWLSHLESQLGISHGNGCSTTLPVQQAIQQARSALPTDLPQGGLGFEKVEKHLLDEIVPGLNGSSLNPRYYGFVTGGVTKSALVGDVLASFYDQNVQVHLPEQTVATNVETAALDLLKDLFHLDRETWTSGTFTTGATASNIIGLACGREHVLRLAAEKAGSRATSVGKHGLLEVLNGAGISSFKVLSTRPHSSLTKGASVVGIGRANVKSIHQETDTMAFDMDRLVQEVSAQGAASIVAISCGEINTGHFATSSFAELRKIREICDEYGVWMHVDGAFGLFGRLLEDGEEFDAVRRGCEGLELADSITGDAHKLLNVPYDCGFFFCRHKSVSEQVFLNGNAAYLSHGHASAPSPLNNGIENSRRFRALPVYATLLEFGRSGYAEMLRRQVRLARKIAAYLYADTAYDVLPRTANAKDQIAKTFMIVLFRAKDEVLNEVLVQKINATNKMYVSGTSWEGKPACRIAISNFRATEERDFPIVQEVLEEVVAPRTVG